MQLSLYEFMPYGAPDAIREAPQRLFRSTLSSVVTWSLLFVAIVLALFARPKPMELETRVFVSYRELAPPPPLTDDVAPPPQIAIAPAAAPPVAGTPIPVPDIEAPAEQTIASQEEISVAAGAEATGAGGGNTTIVVTPPPAEELPKLGQYVYADELPVLVTDVLPHYPEIARQSQTEGEVFLRVLVGADGRVKEVHVDVSVPMLDDAAVEAARQWVFKPAIANNRPVSVWISRKVRFRLSNG